MAENLRRMSVKGMKWSGIDSIVTHVVAFVVGLVIARLLTPDDYGTVGMLSIFIAVSDIFVNSGFSISLVRMKNKTDDDYATAFCFNATAGLLMYALLFLTAPAIATFYRMPILENVLRVYAIALVINALQIVPRTKLVVAVDFKTQAMVNLVAALVSGGIGITMAYAGYGLWALVWQSIVRSMVSMTLLWIVTGWKPWKGHPTKSSFDSLFSFGSKLMVSGLLHTVYNNISKLVIGKFYTPADLGLYSRGQGLAELPSMQITSILQRVSYPVLARLQDDEQQLTAAYRRYLCVSSMVIFFLIALLVATANPLVVLLLTEKWIGAVPFLRIFCLALVFDHICQINNNMLYVKGRSDLFFKLEIAKKVIVFPLLLLAIPYGVIAICFIPVVHTLVDLLPGTYLIGRLMSVSVLTQVKDYGIYLPLSLLACVPAFLLCQTDLTYWLSLTAAVIISSLLYLWMLRHDANMMELVRMVRLKQAS